MGTKGAKKMNVEVHIIESERGWGKKIEETLGFSTRKEAEAFVEDYNKRNDKTAVPDWYMYAVIADDMIRR